MAGSEGIYFITADQPLTGDCFCVSAGKVSGQRRVEGILRGQHVESLSSSAVFVVSTAGYEETITLVDESGWKLKCEPSKKVYPQVLAAAAGTCVGVKLTGLWEAGKSDLPLLVANGYFMADITSSAAALVASKITEDSSTKALTMETSAGDTVVWKPTGDEFDYTPAKGGASSSRAYTQIGRLGVLAGDHTNYDNVVYANGTTGLIIAYNGLHAIAFWAPVTGDILDGTNWDVSKSTVAYLGTALTGQHSSVFLGEYGTRDNPQIAAITAVATDADKLTVYNGPVKGAFTRAGLLTKPIPIPSPDDPGKDKKKDDDDSGLFVALLLGLLGYALLKS